MELLITNYNELIDIFLFTNLNFNSIKIRIIIVHQYDDK